MAYIELTSQEKELVQKLNHPHFTVDLFERLSHLEEFENSKDVQDMISCVNYLEAVKQMLKMQKAEHKAGLYEKYSVTKNETGEPVFGCFILRPEKDKAAVEALKAYAQATPNKQLADDIYRWIEEL